MDGTSHGPLVCFVSTITIPRCRHIDAPRWTLVHLTRLAVLTLSGDDPEEVMLELLRSRPAPVLATSLRALRLDQEAIG